MSTDAGQHTTTHWYHSPVFKYLIDGLLFFAYFFIAGVLQGGVSGTSISM
ncbi:MAG: hypothetical protein IJR15_07330 [Clostridiales bacterium]|nr:hypothetical protein [Clostridiales bacterium]